MRAAADSTCMGKKDGGRERWTVSEASERLWFDKKGFGMRRADETYRNVSLERVSTRRWMQLGAHTVGSAFSMAVPRASFQTKARRNNMVCMSAATDEIVEKLKTLTVSVEHEFFQGCMEFYETAVALGFLAPMMADKLT